MSRAARLLITTWLACVAIWVCAQPASAHGAGGAASSNYRTTITAVRPALADISIQVKEHGDRLQLRNNSANEVIIFGYQDEPYIKVTKSAVFENRLSPAVYTNADRYGTTTPPSYVNANAQADWRKVSSGNVAVWHDHRAHWMSRTAPPVVVGDRGISHVLIPDWTVPLSVAGTPATITGNVVWIPPGPTFTWLPVVAASAIAVVLLARLRSLSFAVVAGVSVLVVADAIHVFGLLIGGAGRWQSRLGSAIATEAASLVLWCTGVWVLSAARRRQHDVVGYVGFFTAAAVWLLGGLTDISTLWHSQLSFAWPQWIARGVVACTLGCGAATTAASALLIYRSVARARLADAGHHDDSTADNQKNRGTHYERAPQP